MPPRPIYLSVTATITPPLEPDQSRDAGAHLASLLDGQLVMASHSDDGWTAWKVAVDHDPDRGFGHLLADAEHFAGAAILEQHTDAGLAEDDSDHHVIALEALTQDEIARRLTTHGVPAPGEMRASERELPPIPEVVTTTRFAELCGRTSQRIRQLRAERQAADERGESHPFPAEFIAGHWLREDAEAYAATLRGGSDRTE